LTSAELETFELNAKKFSYVFISFFFAYKVKLQVLKFELSDQVEVEQPDKRVINWQNFAQVGLQLKFLFKLIQLNAMHYLPGTNYILTLKLNFL